MVVVHILDVVYAFHSFGFGRFETIMRNASLRCKCLECSPGVGTKDVLPGDPRCNVLFQMAGQDPTTAHRLAKRLFRPWTTSTQRSEERRVRKKYKTKRTQEK